MNIEDVKLGELYRIREWDDMEEEYGLSIYSNIDCNFAFMQEMKYYCGKVVKVESKCTDGEVCISMEGHDGAFPYTFSADMIEPLEEKEVISEVTASKKYTVTYDDQFERPISTKLTKEEIIKWLKETDLKNCTINIGDDDNE